MGLRHRPAPGGRKGAETSQPDKGSTRKTAARRAAGDARRVAEAAAEEAKRLSKGGPPDLDQTVVAPAFAPAGRPSDVFGGEVRRRDIFTLLVFHLISNSDSGASYGNQLIERIEEITAGTVSLNPNTMYPLLRRLESDGFIEGSWEHPEKRSRRLYTITEAGRTEYDQLRAALEPFLDSIVQSISLIKREIYGA
jgi:DNA-binding PadR family transcriptional regulator